jgi:uncharacterized protein (DUF58 family)
MRPSLALVWPLGAGFLALAVVHAAFSETHVWWWLPLLLIVPAAVDVLLTLRRPPLVLERVVAQALTQGRAVTVRLALTGPRLRRLAVFDGIPASVSAQLPLKKSRFDGRLELSYEATPMERGRFSFVPAWVDHASAWGFWIRRVRVGPTSEVRVFPDWHVFLDHLDLPSGTPGAGPHQVRRRGQGLEFHQLRDYRQGDLARMVDGKATSRLRKLVVREMQEEQDQTVVFLLDTGYRMTDIEDGVRHFDRAFEAMLALAHTALKQGDRVGVLTWGPDARWIPPVRGDGAFASLVQRLYDVQARSVASSASAALQEVLPRLSRRSLLVLLTNFREEDGEDLLPLLPSIRSRHLLCTVWLREAFLDEWRERVPRGDEEELGTAMAARYERDRLRGRRRSEAEGLFTVDVRPALLRGELLRTYWNIKKRGLL